MMWLNVGIMVQIITLHLMSFIYLFILQMLDYYPFHTFMLTKYQDIKHLLLPY
jgi:hypothetical protein